MKAKENISEESNQEAKSQNNLLEKYCINLNKKAKLGKIDPLIGRKKEINRTVQILCRRLKNNPLFVGDPRCRQNSIS